MRASRVAVMVVGLLVVGMALLAAPVLANASVWPQDGYDGGHSSYNRRERSLRPAAVDGLRLAWRRTVGPDEHGYEQFTRATVVRGGRVYAAWHEDHGSRLVALDADDGSRLWGSRHPFAYAIFAASTRGSVIAQVGSRVIARDAVTGAALWERDAIRISAARRSGSALFVEFYDGSRSIGAISGVDGSVLWRRTLRYRRAPIVAGGSVLVTTRRPGKGSLMALDPSSGETRWRRAIPPRSDGLIAADGRVYVIATSEGRSEVLAFGATDGGREWTRSWASGSALGEVWVGAAGDGLLLGVRTRCVAGCEGDSFGEHRGVLLALDAGSGRTAWARRGGEGFGAPLWSPDVVVPGVVFVHRVEFGRVRIAALSTARGQVLWSAGFGSRTIGVVSAVADGRVFVGTASGYRAPPNAGGRLYALEVPEA